MIVQSATSVYVAQVLVHYLLFYQQCGLWRQVTDELKRSPGTRIFLFSISLWKGSVLWMPFPGSPLYVTSKNLSFGARSSMSCNDPIVRSSINRRVKPSSLDVATANICCTPSLQIFVALTSRKRSCFISRSRGNAVMPVSERSSSVTFESFTKEARLSSVMAAHQASFNDLTCGQKF